MDYQTDVVRTLDQLRTIVPEWRDFLTDGTLGRSFYNDPERILFVLEGSPNLIPHIVVLRKEGRLCCVAPFYITHRRIVLRLSVLKLFSVAVRRAGTIWERVSLRGW